MVKAFIVIGLILLVATGEVLAQTSGPGGGAQILTPLSIRASLSIAQGPAPGAISRLTLADAIAQALAQSHRLAELLAREDAATASERTRALADRPQLTLLAGYTRTSHVPEFAVTTATGARNVLFPDIPDNWRTRLDVQWPIYTSGRVDALVRAARAERDATAHDREAARGDLRLEVARAFWSLVTAGETVRVVEQSVRRLDAHLDAVRAQLRAGIVPPNDVLTVEAQRSRQQVLLIEATNTRSVVEADLRRLVGIETRSPIEPQGDLATPLEPLADEATLVAEARASRAERRALVERIDAQAARGDATAATQRPTVALAGGYDLARPNPRIVPRRAETDDSWDVSLNVSWSLWDGGRARSERAEMAAVERALRARLDEFDSLLQFEVTSRRLEVESAAAAIVAATDGVRSATEARRVVFERFSAGVATSVDLLDAQVALLQAELDRTRTLANVQIALARLDRARGR